MTRNLALILSLIMLLCAPLASAELGESEGLTHYTSEFGFTLDYSPDDFTLIDKEQSMALTKEGVEALSGVLDQEAIDQYLPMIEQFDIILLMSNNPQCLGDNINVIRQASIPGLTNEFLFMLEDTYKQQFKALYSDAVTIPDEMMKLVTLNGVQWVEMSYTLSLEGSVGHISQYTLLSGDYMYLFTLTAQEGEGYQSSLDTMTRVLLSFKLTDVKSQFPAA